MQLKTCAAKNSLSGENQASICSPPQDARFLHDFRIVYNHGASSVSANSQILRAAFPILRQDTYDSLILPTATDNTIAVILKLAYTGRLENTVVHKCSFGTSRVN